MIRLNSSLPLLDKFKGPIPRARVAMFSFIVLFAAIGGYLLLTSSHAAIPGSYDEIDSGMAGKCLDVWYDGSENGTTVDLYACNKTAAQQWTLNSDGTIENANGACLDNWKRSPADHNPIRMFICSSRDPAEQWTLAGGVLRNPQTGKCIDDPSFSTDNGKPLELYTCNGGQNQEWVARRLAAKIWLTDLKSVQSMQQKDGASQSFLNRALPSASAYTWVAGSGLKLTTTVGTRTFASGSYKGIEQAFASGILPGKFKAVLYDNERWQYTPVQEQQNPAYYEQQTAELLHRHGLLYIAAPTPDLMWSVGRPKDSYAAFLQAGYEADAARYADIVDVQGQQKEKNLPYFTQFVTAAAKQAREANPHVKVIIGIRTYPGNGGVTTLFNAYKVANSVGDGYWLNVNGQTKQALYLLRRVDTDN